MENTENLDIAAFYPVRHDIGQAWNNKFQCAPHTPRPAYFRVFLKLVDSLTHSLCDFPRRTAVVSGDVVLNAL